MQTHQPYCMHPTDILVFLKDIKPNVQSLEDLLVMIREENQRAEVYGQQHIPELMEVSAYQWQLEQLEMKLKAPSLIKITFSGDGQLNKAEKSLEENAEELLLAIVMRLISKNSPDDDETERQFRLIMK